MTIFRTVSSPKSVYTDQLAQASHTATIANAITQTVQHYSIPGAGIFAGPHRYNNARLHYWRPVVSFVLYAALPPPSPEFSRVRFSDHSGTDDVHTTRR